jgi:CCR4-NOT transcriptional regulation complex NOT5 subunit
VGLNHYIYKKMSTLQQIAKASRLAERESNREKLHQRRVANGIAKAERRARSLPISTLPQLDQVQTTPGSLSPELISLRKNNASNQNKMASLPVTEVPLAPPSTPVAVPTGVAKGVSANNLAQGLGLVAANRATENAPANKQKQLLNNLKNKINV